MYEQDADMVNLQGNQSNAPALLQAAEGVAPDVRSIGCRPIVPQILTLPILTRTIACGLARHQVALSCVKKSPGAPPPRPTAVFA